MQILIADNEIDPFKASMMKIVSRGKFSFHVVIVELFRFQKFHNKKS